MSEREQINSFLKKLDKYLSRLSQEESTEVLREIESHIYDVIELKESQNEDIVIEDILQGFGAPRGLAEQYTNHITLGTPPPEGFSAITKVRNKVTKGLLWSTLLVGYGVAGGLLVLAFTKLLFPDVAGIWVSSNYQSIVIGIIDDPKQYHRELLGFWIVPISLFAGFFLAKYTRSISIILKRHLI